MKRLTPKQIKRRRLDHGMSQQQLAESVGLKSGSYISFIENGLVPEDASVLDQISELLSAPVPPEVAKRVEEKALRRKLRRAAEKRRAARTGAMV